MNFASRLVDDGNSQIGLGNRTLTPHFLGECYAMFYRFRIEPEGKTNTIPRGYTVLSIEIIGGHYRPR